MVSERVKSSVPCVFIAISCAAIALSALVIYDVVKIDPISSINAAFLYCLSPLAITTKTSTTLRAGPGGRTAVPSSTRQAVREQRITHTKLSKGTTSTNNERHNANSTRTGERRDASTDAKNDTKDTQASFVPDEPSANVVPRWSVESVTNGVSQTAKGEAFETAPDDSGYGATGDPRREGRMGGEERVANRLLCTAGSRAYSEEMLPTDGICDVMFYTDVVWHDGTIRGAQNQESWEAFQAVAQTATRTGHGMSVDYGRANDFFGSLTAPLGRRTLRELFFKRIVHYGILKAAGTVAQLLDDMHGKLNLLKALKQLQEKFTSEVSGTRPRLDLVLGVRFSSYGSPNDSKQHSAAITALCNHFPITVFVIHTHIEDWEMGRYPLIGTLWDYGQDGANAVKTPSLVCTRKGGAAVVNKGLVKLYSAGYNRTYAYDDAETMTAKAAAFFKLYQHMCRGWAVFDAEFEDYDDTCGNGTFSRLKTFKAKLGA
ncbi:hypothetical protein HPB50_013166 [Hyalomma asiaticum]|uniref:Uncharacterized protein n=1 Tax=Hyalomma asiaticum TaxID=266040 RepID=A0ACB7S8V9_HYAAI|nr:hypothetical protein HPB50_013166 [Hyalomma asiaticum]